MDEEGLRLYEESKTRTQEKVCTVEFSFIGYPDTVDTEDEDDPNEIPLNMTTPGCTVKDAIREAKGGKYSSMKRKIEAEYEADQGYEKKQKGFRIWIYERDQWTSYKENTPTSSTRLSDMPGFEQGVVQATLTYTGCSPAEYEDHEDEHDEPPQPQRGDTDGGQIPMDMEDDAKSGTSKRTFQQVEAEETSGDMDREEDEDMDREEDEEDETPIKETQEGMFVNVADILGNGKTGQKERQGDRKRREQAEKEKEKMAKERAARLADLQVGIAEREARAKAQEEQEEADRENAKKQKNK